jgi:hypothetical protein
MTALRDSHLLLIILWLVYSRERRFAMHIVKLLERRFPKKKGNITSILLFLSFGLLLLGVGLLFLQ